MRKVYQAISPRPPTAGASAGGSAGTRTGQALQAAWRQARRSPRAMFKELGCSCHNCSAAVVTLGRGMSVCSDAIQLNEKSWLEAFDTKHRYGSNLNLYFRHWMHLGRPERHFWAWLDSSPQAVELPECPRVVLERETVSYLDTAARRVFRARMAGGVLSWAANGTPITTPAAEEWIFVVAACDGHMYCHRKETETAPRFQHSSFLGAEAVRVAGKFCTVAGQITNLSLHSGHYRPREDRDLVGFLKMLERNGADLSSVRVDVQRIIKTARDGGGSLKKRPKRESQKLWRGSKTVWYLEHRNRAAEFLQALAPLGSTNSAAADRRQPLREPTMACASPLTSTMTISCSDRDHTEICEAATSATPAETHEVMGIPLDPRDQ